MNATDIVIRNQFTNKKSPGHGNVKGFIMNYMLRDSAVEPLMVTQEQQDRYLDKLNKYRQTYGTNELDDVNKFLGYDGIAFSLDNISLSRANANDLADECQDAYDRGATVKQMVLSFDSNWLMKQKLLDDDVTLPAFRGDFRGKVNQYRLREAVMDGINSMVDQTTMHSPQMVGAIQTDTGHVHVHITLWDNDPKVKDDRGMINETQKNALRAGIDYSVNHSPRLVNETTNLQNAVGITKANAKFKMSVLEKQLYDTAMRLDRPSMDQYVSNLALFDERTLSERQRQNLSKKIVSDFRREGRRTYRSHTLSQGQRRARRQIKAMKSVVSLKKEIGRFNNFASKGVVSDASFVVKDAMKYELIRQERVVEKYRRYQRPRVDAIYQVRKGELDKQRFDLMNKRVDVLERLNTNPINTRMVARILKDQTVLTYLNQNNTPVTNTKIYQELNKALYDAYYPLSDDTIQTIKHAYKDSKSNDELNQLEQDLTKNQQVDVSKMTPSQKLLYFEYLEEWENYEINSVSWGGRSSLGLLDNDGRLPEPSKHESIYEREFVRNDADILSVDLHDVLDSGPLKPEIELAYRKQLGKRANKLLKANDYFVNTNQELPRWLREAKSDLNEQFRVLNNCTGVNVSVSYKELTPVLSEGFDVGIKNRRDLVKKHLRDVNELVL